MQLRSLEETFSLSQSSLEDLYKKLSIVRFVNIFNMECNRELFEYLKQAPCLEVLVLDYCTNATAEDIASLLTVPTIRFISIRGTGNLPEQVKNCVSAKFFIEKCIHLDDESAENKEGKVYQAHKEFNILFENTLDFCNEQMEIKDNLSKM